MINRIVAALLALVALGGWIGLGVYTAQIPPATLANDAAFFAVLFVALAATGTLVAYAIGLQIVRSRLYQQSLLRHALRQGVLLATFGVANLALGALRAWSAISALLILAALVLIEFLSSARKNA